MKKRLRVRSRKVKETLEERSREDIRKDFFELLKIASRSTDFRS